MPCHSQTEERESLQFKLKGTADFDRLAALGDAASASDDNLGAWGHEFVRSLAGEVGQEYSARVIAGANPEDDEPFKDLLGMVDVIVPFNVGHNAEAEAVDLLIEVQRLKKILELDSIDEGNYRRVCMYLIKTADFMSDPDDYAVSWPPVLGGGRRRVLSKKLSRERKITASKSHNRRHGVRNGGSCSPGGRHPAPSPATTRASWGSPDQW